MQDAITFLLLISSDVQGKYLDGAPWISLKAYVPGDVANLRSSGRATNRIPKRGANAGWLEIVKKRR